MCPPIQVAENFQQALQPTLAQAGASAPVWLSQRQQVARATMEQMGFPTQRQEAWKYVDIKPILNQPFGFNSVNRAHNVQPEQIEAYLLTESQNSRLVFINGHYAEHLSSLTQMPLQVQVHSIQQLLDSDPDRLKTLLEAHSQPETDAFTALNTALLGQSDGVVIQVAAGYKAPSPIQLLFLSTDDAQQTSLYPRCIVSVEAGAQVNVVSQWMSLTEAAYVTVPVVDVIAQEHAKFGYIVIQNESKQAYHLATTRIQAAAHSSIKLSSIAFGSRLTRQAVQVTFTGEQATCTLNGLSLLEGQTQVYNNTVMDHQTSRCTSRQLYKAILDHQARAEYDGTIFVRRNAVENDATQLNKNLMLSDDARAYARPQLRIDNEDVKCSHGATVGQLEEEELFYLASRGLSREVAQDVLTYGFAEEVIEKLPVPSLRAYLDQLVLKQLCHTYEGGVF